MSRSGWTKPTVVLGGCIDDMPYTKRRFEDKKLVWRCPLHKRWSSILDRVYGKNNKGSFLCEEWRNFSSFHQWMSSQEWEGCDLDKDILIVGNRIYSPRTCAFVPESLNGLLNTGARNMRGFNQLPIGVKPYTDNRMVSRPSKPYIAVSGKTYCGYFSTPEQAHAAWQLKKAELIEVSVNDYANHKSFRTDVAEALTTRVWKLRLDNIQGKETTVL